MHDSAQALRGKKLLLVGFTLFSMFFGAGNLIFPPFLGAQAGTALWLAFAGFAVSAIGLPIAGVAAVARAGGLPALAGRVHPRFAQVFAVLVYLSIGPCLAIPRTASTSFEMLTPLVGRSTPGQFIYSLAFFAAAYFVALKPEKLTQRLGRILCPALLVLIVVLFTGCILRPAAPGYGTPAEAYAALPAAQGVLDGYQTMDALAALNFGAVIALNIQAVGITEEAAVRRGTIRAGLIAGGMLLVVYAMLTHIGGISGAAFPGSDTGASVLTALADGLFGRVGQVLLAVIFVIACFNTCVGLLLDMLRVLDNPTLDTSLAAIMLSPMFWFTPEDLMRIRMLGKKTSLYSAVCMAIGVTESAEPVQLDDVLVQKCRQLYDTLQKLRQSSGMMTLEALIRRIYDTTDFLSVMQLTKDGDRKRANLHLLLQYAKQYEENTDAAHNGVSGFLRYIDWLLDSGNDFQQTSLTAGVENAVAVKTMHRSKGLEYPFVFLGKLESPFSTEDSRKNAVFSEKGLVGFCIKNPENYTRAKTMPFAVLEQENRNASRSEELRLLYVAMTRAKQQLFLPLNLKKVRTRTTDYLAQYSTLILPDGTLPPLTVQNAGSMAHWVWMCLVLRHDAVLAREINLPPQCWNTPAWSEKLQIHYEFSLPPVTKSDTLPEQAVIQPDADTLKDLKKITAFQYTSPDCGRHSLLSVSALQEAHQKRAPVWKRPDFRLQEGHLTGAERGTAIHTFFQYADFRKAQADVPAEIQRLQTYGFLTPEQAAAVKPEIPAAFFRDDLYRRLCRSKRVLREQKFLVQCRDLSAYPETAAILRRYENSDSILKGIIDLAFQEGDHFVLVDYKTDTVSSPDVLVDSYREQLMLYCGALQCITGMPVKECYLYSTHFQKSIEVKP